MSQAFRPPPANDATAGSRDQALAVAFVQNAVQAMSLGSQLAALNNLDQAIGRTQTLQGGQWYTPRTAGAAPSNTASPPLDANGANARLISAKAKLLQGDKAGATADLTQVADAVPPGFGGGQLLLLRASASLGLTQAAVDAGRIDEAKVQLQAAAAQLRSFSETGGDDSDEAKSLAQTIGERASSTSAVDQLTHRGELARWMSQVDRWLGGPSKGASLVVAMQSTGRATGRS